MSVFVNYLDFYDTESFFARIRIRILVKVRSGSGSVTNFFRSWIRIKWYRFARILSPINNRFFYSSWKYRRGKMSRLFPQPRRSRLFWGQPSIVSGPIFRQMACVAHFYEIRWMCSWIYILVYTLTVMPSKKLVDLFYSSFFSMFITLSFVACTHQI